MSAPLEFQQTVEVVFHNIEYLLTVASENGDTLCIEVEQKDNGYRWRGDFTSRYIEDITQKTGNFKKYNVFVKMLLTALTESSESVFVDLLTYADLEMLKNRRLNRQAPPAQKTTSSNNKRYLILTYAAEFDRVHYPLPLLFEEEPEPETLKETIRRLSEELAGLRSGRGSTGRIQAPGDAAAEIQRLQNENTRLRSQLSQQGGAVSSGEKSEAVADLMKLRQERDTLLAHLDDLEAQVAHLQEEMGESKAGSAEVAALRRKVVRAEEELAVEKGAHSRAMLRKSKECEALADELLRAKEAEKRLRGKLRDLQADFDAMDRRLRGMSPTSTQPWHYDPTRGGGGHSRSNSLGLGGGGVRRSSAGSSREPSRGSSPTSSRPSSAGLGARFDPTAYVRARERQRQATDKNRSRSPSPAEGRRMPPNSTSPRGPIRPPSPTGGAPPRRRSSMDQRGPSYASGGSGGERSRRTSSGSESYGNRPVSAGATRSGGRASMDKGVGTRRPVSGRVAAGSSEEHEGSRQPRVRSAHARSGSRGSKGAWSSDDEGGPPMGGSRSRGPESASPGKVLAQVKERLSQYSEPRGGEGDMRHGGGSSGREVVPLQEPSSGNGGSKAASKAAAYEDASSEIADIDSRLHALQNFLRQAKSGK
eukprot:jgi/Mesvir1/23175/Mv22647-RA.1